MAATWFELAKDLLRAVAGGLDIEVEFRGFKVRIGTGGRAKVAQADEPASSGREPEEGKAC
jgi:hypothetical protein